MGFGQAQILPVPEISWNADEALHVLEKDHILQETMKEITDRIQFYLDHRSYDQILLGAVIFSNEFGYLGQTPDAEELISRISQQ